MDLSKLHNVADESTLSELKVKLSTLASLDAIKSLFYLKSRGDTLNLLINDFYLRNGKISKSDFDKAVAKYERQE